MSGKASIFLISLTAFLLILSNAQATSELREINKLTGAEKATVEENITRPNVEYNVEGLRNPFQNLIKKAEDEEESVARVPEAVKENIPQLPNLSVQGIVWGGDFPQAIINNKVVKAGDSVDSCMIKEINKEGITLLFRGFEYKLSSPATGGKI